jgi:hypothetical protein
LKSLKTFHLVGALKQRLGEQLRLNAHERNHFSFYLEAPELVPNDDIKTAINAVLKEENHIFDSARHDNILIFDGEKCLGWVSFSNFSGQEPFLIIVSVFSTPRKS